MVVVMKKMLVVALESKVGHRVACQIRSYFFTIRGFKKAGELDAVRTGKIMLGGYLSALYDLDKLSDADYYFLRDLTQQVAFGRSSRLHNEWRRLLK